MSETDSGPKHDPKRDPNDDNERRGFGRVQRARAALIASHSAAEAAAAATAAGFGRLMLGALLALNTGAILGLAALLLLSPPDDVLAQDAAAALHLFLYAYGAAFLAAGAGWWSAELQGLQAAGRRNREIELLNRAVPEAATPSGHAAEAERWRDDAAAQGRRAGWAFALCWGAGALCLVLTIWGVLQAAALRGPEPEPTQAAEPTLMERVELLENELELNPPNAADAALMRRIALLERQLELHPPQSAGEGATDLMNRVELLERQLELNPPNKGAGRQVEE